MNNDVRIFTACAGVALLASCRSARTIETSTAENVDVTVCSKDSMVHDVDFQFDKLEYWVDYVCAGGDDDSQNSPARVRKVVITNGSVSEKTDRVRLDADDYKSVYTAQTKEVISQQNTSSKVNYLLIGTAIVVFFLIIKRIRLPT